MFKSPGAIALDFGPIQVHWYGILIGIGILLAYWYATIELKRRNLDRKPVDDMAFFVILAGVIGARLYYVLFNLAYFIEKPVEILQIWKGGLAIHGALLGGALAFFTYVFIKKIPWRTYADVVIPGVLLAQAVGRWGNFFNNEAFGRPTSSLLKLYIPPENRPAGYENFSYFEPTFLYESVWNLLGFVILFVLSRIFYSGGEKSEFAPGLILFSYLIWYSIGRFFIEILRTDSLYIGQFKTAQVMSIILFLIGLIGLIFSFRKHTIKGV